MDQTEGVQTALLTVAGGGGFGIGGAQLPSIDHWGFNFDGGQCPFIYPVSGIGHGRLIWECPPATVADYLQKFPAVKAVILVSPNYFGAVSDISAMADLCHDRAIPLIIDSAHGSHLGFHPDLPPSPIACGADLVIQSHPQNPDRPVSRSCTPLSR
jgi:hypothetical protein